MIHVFSFSTLYVKTCAFLNLLFTMDISQNMHFDVVLSEFILPCTQKRRRAQYSRGVDAAVCVRALQMCVCACASDVCVCACASDVCVCVCALDVCVCVRFRCVCVCVRFRCVCVRALQMCVCACTSDVCVCVRALQCAENFSHSVRLLLQQSRAFYMVTLREIREIEGECTRWW